MDGYLRKREFYGDYSGSLPVTAFTGATTLVACKPGHAIHVQRISSPVSTAVGGATWTFKDSAGVVIANPSVATVTADPSAATTDFGPDGVTLTAGADLVFTPSVGGAAGVVTWDAFQQLRHD
jgi:hypothetical protein